MERCRLYLAAPGAPGSGSKPAAPIRDALEQADIACVLISRPETGPYDPDWVQEIVALCQSAGVATLIEDQPDMAKAFGLDGVHVTGVDAYEEAREIVGTGVIVGGGAGLSRHDAMLLAERGADYVGLGERPGDARTEDMVGWWAALIEIPCVAWQAADADEALRLASRGADFICLAPEIWTASSPVEAIARLDRDLRGLPSAA